MVLAGVAWGAWLSLHPAREARVWLFEARKVRRDQAERVVRALQTGGIDARLDDRGRVTVPGGQRGEAMQIVAQQKLDPRSLKELREEFGRQSSWLEGQEERQERLVRQREVELETMLEGFPEIASADVLITRARATGQRGGSGWTARATVRVQHSEEGRPLSEGTISSVRALVASLVPDLAQDGVAIFDANGRPYLAPGHPEAVVQTQREARELQIRKMLEEQLHWIDGLTIHVQVEPGETSGAGEGSGVGGVMALNRPLELEPEAGIGERVRLVMQVPTSHYIRVYRSYVSNQERMLEELQPYIARTEERIRKIAQGVMQGQELAGLLIERVDDPNPLMPVLESAPVRGMARLPRWWPYAAAGAVAGLLGLGLMARVILGRSQRSQRRAGRVEVGSQTAWRLDEAAERVRALVRTDAKLAAGIVERWIEQGGGEG
jgi:hypothetical protein